MLNVILIFTVWETIIQYFCCSEVSEVLEYIFAAVVTCMFIVCLMARFLYMKGVAVVQLIARFDMASLRMLQNVLWEIL